MKEQKPLKCCEAEGCTIEFEPSTANQKYAYPNCRKTIDSFGICKTRKEIGMVDMPSNFDTGEVIESDVELRLAYSRLLQEYEKVKNKKIEVADAIYRAVEHDIKQSKYLKVAKPLKDPRRTKNEEVAVAILADWQLAKVTPDYNTDICEERIYKFAEKIISLTEIQRQDHPVKKIHVWVLGDIVEGELIFPGQSFLVDGGLYRQVTIDGPRIMKNFFTRLLEAFEFVDVTCVIGNHGRLTGRGKGDYDPETNADRMLYQIVRLIFENEPRINFNIPDGRGERNFYAIGKVGNYSSLLIHGDQFTTINSVPSLKSKIYGWKVGAIQKTSVDSNNFAVTEHFDDVFMGHFHTPSKFTFNTVQLRVSGSPESTNTYAIERLGAVGRPSQPLMFVHPEKGIVTAEYTCWLD